MAEGAEIPECATSPSISQSMSMRSHALSDSQESRVHFEETPEIILFLSADEGVAEELSAVAEEDERGQADERDQLSSSRAALPQMGETPLAVPAPHDVCEGGGGLADLAADAWSE